MGAFDNSYDDEKVAAHEMRRMKRELAGIEQYSTEELRAELKKREEAEELAKYPQLADLFISVETMNKTPLLVIDNSGDLMIQYPDGHNEFFHKFHKEWMVGGFRGHDWVIRSIKAGESTPIGWIND